jgi:hypothetical protein
MLLGFVPVRPAVNVYDPAVLDVERYRICPLDSSMMHLRKRRAGFATGPPRQTPQGGAEEVYAT